MKTSFFLPSFLASRASRRMSITFLMKKTSTLLADLMSNSPITVFLMSGFR